MPYCASTLFGVAAESLPFFGRGMEEFGVFQRLFGPCVLISFRGDNGMLITLEDEIAENERDREVSGTTCYNSLLNMNMQGQLMGKHRSLALRGAERLVWAQGDDSTMQVHKLPCGTIGDLLGREHHLPLARSALYAWGTQIYIATS
jgi:predicted amidohydrolase